MLKNPATHKLFMLIGLITTAATLYLAWLLLQQIEPRAVETLREQILAELDLQSFHQQLQALEAEARTVGEEYSAQQLEILNTDTRMLWNEASIATEKLQRINRDRAELMWNIKITMFAALIVLSASLVLIIFGFIGWRFRIRVIEETP
jgi:hypothetical protein